MTIKIGINGAGRIGRNILRAWIENPEQFKSVEIVAINDLASIETVAHLLQYDSVHGRLNQPIQVKEDKLSIGKHVLQVTQTRDPSELPWSTLGVEVVFECTGLFTNKEACLKHIDAGASKVIISAPGKEVDATIVYGVNHDSLRQSHQVISNASCTTNCLAPLVKPLHEAFGIEQGLMTTIHAFTNDQQLTDSLHQDVRRARAATQSMIPTKTGAAAAIGLVMPELLGKLDGFAMRVPTINVSVVDLTFQSNKLTSVDEVNACLREAAGQSPLDQVVAINEEPLVSIDFNHNPASSIFDLTQTRVLGSSIKVLAWYDNEWGFSNRMLDTAMAWMQASE
jgi:glyceraldehyde 3-phosphate dehydrogenase